MVAEAHHRGEVTAPRGKTGLSRKESSIFRTCFRNERDAVHAQGFGKLTESADFFSVTVSPSVKVFFASRGVSVTRAGRVVPVGFLRIGECSFKNENPKLKRSIWDHVFLPCEQSADEPHGSMIYMPSDRIGKPLRRHSWRVAHTARSERSVPTSRITQRAGLFRAETAYASRRHTPHAPPRLNHGSHHCHTRGLDGGQIPLPPTATFLAAADDASGPALTGTSPPR